MTSGMRMPLRQCVLAAQVTMASNGQLTKSANWSSTIGRSPIHAAPMAAPTKPSSAIGVSITRSAPNSSNSPLETPNGPPKWPTSSPMQEHPLVLAHGVGHARRGSPRGR